MKLAIVVRKDLGMSCGKIAGQVGHASVMAYKASTNETWYSEGQKKIVLKTEDGVTLTTIACDAESKNLSVHYVRDFGLTQVEPNTLTCIAIGPDTDEKIDSVVGDLKLL